MDVEANTGVERNRVLESEQPVRNVEEVEEGEVPNAHVGASVFQVDAYRGCQRNCPEQSAGIRRYARVEVMDLGFEVNEVILTSVQIQSDKPKRPFVDGTIHSDIYTTHKPHIGVEE